MSHAPPLAGFLDALRREGLPVGVDDHLRISMLLARQANWTPIRLRNVLRCSLAKDPHEQEVFDRVFEGFFTDFAPQVGRPGVEDPVGGAVEPIEIEAVQGTMTGRRRLLFALAVVLAIIPLLIVGASRLLDLGEGERDPKANIDLIEADAVVDSAGPDDAGEDNGDAWIKASAQAGAGLAFVVFAGALGQRRRRVQATFVPGPFRFRPVPAPGSCPPAWDPEQVEDAAAALTFRTRAEAQRRIDPELTAERTAQAAGYPAVVWQRPPSVPEIAVLLDMAPAGDAWRPLYEELFARLRAAGVDISLHGFAEDPSLCWPREAGAHGDPTPLEELCDRVDSLVIVGDGQAGIDLMTDRPAPWLALLQRFPRRLWLNPLPPSRWSRGAWAVAASTPMEPATTAGLATLSASGGVRRPDALEDRPLPPAALTAPASALGQRLLEVHLGPAFDWLCACAVLGQPDPQRALWIGGGFFAHCSESDRLRLITLPWFVVERWPADLRSCLVDALRTRRPRFEPELRRAWARQVESGRPPAGSLAWLQWRLERAHNGVQLGREESAEELVGLLNSPVGEEATETIADLVVSSSRASQGGQRIGLSEQAASLLPAANIRELSAAVRPTRFRRSAQLISSLAGLALLAWSFHTVAPLLFPEQPEEESAVAEVELPVNPEPPSQTGPGLAMDEADMGGATQTFRFEEDVIVGEDSSSATKAEKTSEEEIRRKAEMEREAREAAEGRLMSKQIGTRGESSSGSYTDDLFGQTGDAEGPPPVNVSGRVSAGTVDVGGNDPARIKAAINKYIGQVKACYEQRLKSTPDLAGRVEIVWYITGGRVTSVEVLSNSTGDDELADCIAMKVRTWRFPADLEADTEVMYPFILSPL